MNGNMKVNHLANEELDPYSLSDADYIGCIAAHLEADEPLQSAHIERLRAIAQRLADAPTKRRARIVDAP